MVVNMKKSYIWIFFLFIGCKVGIGTHENEQFMVTHLNKSEAVNFQTLNKFVLTPLCLDCHAWANDELKVQSRMVALNPESSRLFQRVKNNEMPTNGSLSAQQLLIVESYINNPKNFSASEVPPPDAETVEVKTIPLNSTYKSIKFHLLERSCLACHDSTIKMGNLALDNYENVKKKASDILYILDNGATDGFQMPPRNSAGETVTPEPTLEIIEMFRKWIAEGMVSL